MEGLNLRWGALCVAFATFASGYAQNPFNLDTEDASKAQVELGGEASIDVVRLRGDSPGIPLRFGNITPGSEQVSLDGKPLVRGKDYSMDYESGVVYLMRAQKPGMSLSASYRYKKGVSSGAASKGFAGFKYDLVPGGLKAVMGLGIAERGANGSVTTSNVFGLNNQFRFGSGNLSGIYLVGKKNQVDAQGAIGYAPEVAKSDEPDESSFIVQRLATKLGGGEMYLDYQEISQNFTAFGQAEGAVDAAQLNILRKERGLDRMGFGLRDVKLGSSKISANMRSVSDDNGDIGWQEFAFQNGGVTVNYKSQAVGKFARFGDIREADREQLKKEAGMSRETLGVNFQNKLGSLSFSENTVEDKVLGSEIKRQAVKLDTSRVKFAYDSQEVGKDFRRVGNLFEAERGQWGRELGLNRKNMALELGVMGKGVEPIKFNQSIVANRDGKFEATDVVLPGRGWSLSRSTRNVDSAFGNIANMTEAEWDNHIKSIAGMYQSGGFAFNPGHERPRLFASAGIDREVTRFTAKPFKSWDLNIERLELGGAQGGATVDTASLGTKNWSANYRSQKVSEKFHEIGRLLTFEQQRLGVVTGLERTDFGFKTNLGGSKKFEYNQLDASQSDQELTRQQIRFTDKKLEVQVTKREVSKDFNTAGQLVDPEKDVLMNLRGFNQQEQIVKWEILQGLKLDYMDYVASSADLKQDRRLRNTSLSYNPNPKLALSYQNYEYTSDDPMALLFSQKTERLGFTRDLDKYGKISFNQEVQDYDGKDATNLPDMQRRYMSYEKKLDARTSFRTERTETRWDNGEHENINANTVSTQITNKAGVSVTDLQVDRKGDDRDENRRNYGIWYEIAKNVRLSWGYARHLNGDNATANSIFTLSSNANPNLRPDQVMGSPAATLGNLSVGGGYGVNTWEQSNSRERTQAFSNVNLAMQKPTNVGFVKDFMFSFGYDAAADQYNWLRENRLLNASGKIGNNTLGFQYRSQMAPNGDRAIDRVFQFATDNSDKRMFTASVFYKVRTLPNDNLFMIRNYTLAARPLKNLQISHQLLTNPEVARGDVLLGSMIQGANVNRWKVDYKTNGNLTIGGTWDQIYHEQSKAYSVNSGLNVTLFEKSGSPVSIFFGGEEAGGNVGRRYIHRYSIGWNQRPGPNQNLSFFLGNLSYLKGRPESEKASNLSFRLDYQLKF